MSLSLINEAIQKKLSTITRYSFHEKELDSMCQSASRDDQNGIEPKEKYNKEHPLWNLENELAIDKWDVSQKLEYLLLHGFTPECIISKAASYKKFNVTVRAILRGPTKLLENYELPSKWSVYDCKTNDETTVIRAESFIDVYCYAREDAADIAKSNAPRFNLDASVGIELWVDEEQDSDIQAIK